MAGMIGKLERRARYVMGAAAIVGVFGLGAFKLGWIATAPSYKHDAWYLVGGNASVVITSEYADEAACRREENSTAVCRSGSVLIQEALHNQNKSS